MRLLGLFHSDETAFTTHDRHVLERVIFPYVLEQRELQRVLFVGCQWYTRRYNRIFRRKDYWTIEVDPTQSKFGSRRHVVDGLENLARHFDPDALDVILCNGVFGFGLDARDAVEAAFAACHTCLRPGGLFVLGWNDAAEFRPFPLAECASLKRFRPLEFAPLETAEFRTDTPLRHVFSFYTK